MYWTIDRGEESKLYKITERKMKTKSRVHKNYSIWITISLSPFFLRRPCTTFLLWSSLIFTIKEIASSPKFLVFRSFQISQATRIDINRIAQAGASSVFPTTVYQSETDWNCANLSLPCRCQPWPCMSLIRTRGENKTDGLEQNPR